MRISLLLAALLGTATLAHADPLLAPPSQTAPSFSGTYASTFGTLVLNQNGDRVIGTYTYDGGQIDGTVNGDTLQFTWRENAGTGFGRFVLGADGTLTGSWGTTDDHSSGAWTARPGSGSTLDGSGLAASPFGDSALHAGDWSFELYMPWDGTFAAGSGWVGMVGLGAGFGKRLTPDWYLGVTGDVEYLMGTSEYGPDDLTRIRAGVEARYIFGHGSGVGTVNDGPEFGVDRYTWVGARAGYETLDENQSHGEYGELSLGTAFALGHTQLGMYTALGLTAEPDATYRGAMTGTADLSTAPATAPGTDLGVYVSLGMIVTFG